MAETSKPSNYHRCIRSHTLGGRTARRWHLRTHQTLRKLSIQRASGQKVSHGCGSSCKMHRIICLMIYCIHSVLFVYQLSPCDCGSYSRRQFHDSSCEQVHLAVPLDGTHLFAVFATVLPCEPSNIANCFTAHTARSSIPLSLASSVGKSLSSSLKCRSVRQAILTKLRYRW